MQKEDSPDVVGKPVLGVAGTRGPTEYCLQLVLPLCRSFVDQPTQQWCTDLMTQKCQPGDAFLECIISSDPNSRGAKGFVDECMCAPQRLVSDV